MKRVILFRADTIVAGGMERVMFEEAEYLKKNGIDARFLTYDFDRKALFNDTYNPDLQVIGEGSRNRGILCKTIIRILALRKKINDIKPDIIISCESEEAMYLYLATLFTPFAYITHIAQAVSRGYGGLRRSALVYRKALRAIEKSSAGHRDFAPLTISGVNLIKRITAELAAFIEYRAIRKAKRIFLFSNQMKWEVSQLYGREAVVIKGAFPPEILDYKPRQGIKRRLNLINRTVMLTITRLAPQKRVDLIIRAFYKVRQRFDNVVLVIGGTGSEESRLKNLVNDLNVGNSVIFIGFIDEAELWDYYAACEVFISAEWADINLAAYGALALQRKVVWPSSIEVDGPLAGNKHIFPAEITVADYARAMEMALTTEVTEKTDLSIYAWDSYTRQIMENLDTVTA